MVGNPIRCAVRGIYGVPGRMSRRLRVMRYLLLTILSAFLIGAGESSAPEAASVPAASPPTAAEAATPAPAAPTTYKIPAEKVDAQKVYFGSASSFCKPGNVDYEAIIKATPEYDEVRKKRVEVGTGKYWILLSQASDRAVRAISEVGQETGHDLIAANGYLGSLDPPIPAEDVTQLVLVKMTGRESKKK